MQSGDADRADSDRGTTSAQAPAPDEPAAGVAAAASAAGAAGATTKSSAESLAWLQEAADEVMARRIDTARKRGKHAYRHGFQDGFVLGYTTARRQ